MRSGHVSFAGWPGGARAVAPELFRTRDAQVERQFDFLLRVFTPRTVFMEMGSEDGALAVRAASFVERAWCVEARRPASRPPCNLRSCGLGGVPLSSIDVAFSEAPENAEDVCRLLAADGVWFVYGRLVPAQLFREAGFRRVQYFAGSLRVPGALARISRTTTTAAFK
jgi:ketosteroid isomerase-like protein